MYQAISQILPLTDSWCRFASALLLDADPGVRDTRDRVRLLKSDRMDDISIGPYRLLEPVGEGGMGIVYRARRPGSERAVALKTVTRSSQHELDAIRREIQALMRIRHPGVVRIVDHGVQAGRPWYAMDLVEGETLRQFGERMWSPYRVGSLHAPLSERLTPTETVSAAVQAADAVVEPVALPPLPKDGKPPAAAGELLTIIRFFRRICATLAFLHGEGLVNCDLTPNNILVVDGEPVIIDFGLSAHHPGSSGREPILEVQRALGTLPYMSPEQIRGEFVDARSDLYSVGCMMYELVTGRPPFSGPEGMLRAHHLASEPEPPSQLAADVPPALERLILKLLEKRVADRYGHADEVATGLAELVGDFRPIPGFPPARPYLYRPGFVGRTDLVAELKLLRERAVLGSGSFVLLGGESGVGKTRVAMELTRVVPGSRMRIVTSESSSLLVAGSTPVAVAPFEAIRPLLRAVADRCHEGGPAVTAELLGERRSVLAPYEPLLAQVPADDAMVPPAPLPPEASRQRLFRYLAETLAQFARQQSVLWVLDDLGWADDLSLAFVKSLEAAYFEVTPLFMFATYRTEESADVVADIAGLAHVKHLALPRLGCEDIGSIISEMLAMPEPPRGFVDFLVAQSEGNPFFVAEYLRTAITERVMFRAEDQSWKMTGTGSEPVALYESLSLPGSLRDLIERRLRDLGPVAHMAALAAAVLGRESALDAIGAVSDLSKEAIVTAVDELIHRQVLALPSSGVVRFAHDKVREVVYAGVPRRTLVKLHARAASYLEAQAASGPDASRYWAAIGHHFAAARSPEAAARYLTLAADRARDTFANGDAVALYREAIKQIGLVDPTTSENGVSVPQRTLTLHESLGDVLCLGNAREEAREVFEIALGQADLGDRLARARLYRKIGKTWEGVHPQTKAFELYDLARHALGDTEPDQYVKRWRDEWVQLRSDQVFANYWLGRVQEMQGLVDELRLAVTDTAEPWQRVRLHRAELHLCFHRDRYVLLPDGVAHARAAMEHGLACHDDLNAPLAHFNFAFALFLSGDFHAADRELRQALDAAKRSGDVPHQARCLTYLSLDARRAGFVDEVEHLAREARRIASIARMRDYVGVALANEAYLAYRRARLVEAQVSARRALEEWDRMAYVYAFKWSALLPLLAAHVDAGEIDAAAACARTLVEPPQQRLPPEVACALTAGAAAAAAGESVEARRVLLEALDAATSHNFI